MQTFVAIRCPYCGEPLDLAIDVLAGDQSYVEDCQVCCRPMAVSVWVDDDGMPSVTVVSEDEA